MFRLFHRDPRRPVIDQLYGRVVAAARHPPLFTVLGVPDTLEGRFEALTLHMVLVVRALTRLPAPAGDVARDLTEAFFRQLDHSLREMGVGDTRVPKRMKTLAQAYYGRAGAYAAGLDGGEGTLREALVRNVYGGNAPQHVPGEPAAALARYVLASASGLATLDLDRFLTEGPTFPPPEAFAQEPAP